MFEAIIANNYSSDLAKELLNQLHSIRFSNTLDVGRIPEAMN